MKKQDSSALSLAKGFLRPNVYSRVLWRNNIKRLYARCKISLYVNGNVYKKRRASRQNNLFSSPADLRDAWSVRQTRGASGSVFHPLFSFPSRNLNSGKTSLVLAIIKPTALPPRGRRGWQDGEERVRRRGKKREVRQDEISHGRRSRRQESRMPRIYADSALAELSDNQT